MPNPDTPEEVQESEQSVFRNPYLIGMFLGLGLAALVVVPWAVLDFFSQPTLPPSPVVAAILARHEPPATPFAPAATPAPEQGGESIIDPSTAPSDRVYVRGYTRKDGTYVHPHTRRR